MCVTQQGCSGVPFRNVLFSRSPVWGSLDREPGRGLSRSLPFHVRHDSCEQKCESSLEWGRIDAVMCEIEVSVAPSVCCDVFQGQIRHGRGVARLVHQGRQKIITPKHSVQCRGFGGERTHTRRAIALRQWPASRTLSRVSSRTRARASVRGCCGSVSVAKMCCGSDARFS